jgi:sensor domain CHASE-containing protein
MENNFVTGLVVGLIVALIVFIWRLRIEALALKEYHAGLQLIETALKQENSRAAEFVRTKITDIRSKL